MSEVLRMSRKTLSATVVAATIAWSIGLSSLVAPLTAHAAASGSLVKASLPAVYYVGGDGKRYVFPNEKTYKTWYADFSAVITITDAELAAMPIGGNVTYKPGVKMVKITTDPKVYAVDKMGALRWVKTEAAATGLYGADWNKNIDDVPDAFFTNYTSGADVSSVSDFNKSMVSAAATSINQDKGLSTVGGTIAGLSVMMSSTGPTGGTLPKGAMQVNMLKFDVKNGTGAAVSVDSLTVHRTGVGSAADFANVYVYDGNTRLSTGRTINSSSNDASFSGLGLSLAPGETRNLWIAGDIAAAAVAGNNNALQLTDIKSGASSGTGMPLTGPTYTIAGASAGTVTISKSGASPLSNVKAGGMKQKIGEFQLLAGGAEDIRFNKIALFRGGAVSRENVTNLLLTQGGTTVATAAAFDSHDRATFVLATPMLIEKGSTKTLELWADIGAGARAGASETILTYLDQKTDLLAVGATYGYGVTVDSGVVGTYDGAAGCALGAGNCSSTRIEGGQLTTTFNGPSAKNIGINAKNNELYNFTMAAQSNLEIRNLRTQITWLVGTGAVLGAANGLVDTTGAAAANFKNIKVVDTATGATVAGPVDVATGGSDTTQAIVFTETINLTAGQSRTFKVLADVANQAGLANNQVRVDLNAFAASDIRNLDNSTYIALTDIVPNTGVLGNADTLIANTVTVNAAGTPLAGTYIQGTQGAPLGGFTLKAGDAGSIRISSLTLQGQIDNVPGSGYANGMEGAGPNTVATVAQSVKLWQGATQLGATKSPATSAGAGLGGTVTFDNLNLTIAAGQTVTLVVSGNIASGLASLSDNIRWEVTAAGSVAATDVDGNAVVAGGAFPVDATSQTIATAGTVAMTLAPDDLESEAGVVTGNMPGGSNLTVLSKIKFTAANEELKMTKGRFEVTSATGVSSLSLYDGATLVGGPVAPNGAGQADFTGINFVVPKDASKVLTVKGVLNTVGGASGAASGSDVTVKLVDPDRAAGGDAGSFEVRGTSAGSSTLITTNTLTGGDDTATTTGRTKVLRRSKPTITLVALPSTVLNTGNQVVMRFTVSADASGDVAFEHVQLAISKTTNPTLVSSGTSSLRRVGDSANLAGTTAISGALSAGGAASGTFDIFLTNEEPVAAGTSRTYDVRLTVAGAPTSGDSVSSSLNGDGGAAGTETGVIANPGAGTATVAGTARNFAWSDISTVNHGDFTQGSSADWANGRYLKVLPSDTQTMSK